MQLKSSKVWIQFDAEYYDYYLGAGKKLFKDDKDAELHAKYFVDCLVYVGEGSETPVSGASCRAKRHTLIVDLNSGVLSNPTAVKVSVVGIRNPNTISTLKYNIFGMDVAESDDDTYRNDCALFYWTTEATFTSHAAPYLGLYRVQVPENHNDCALAGSNNYKFYFGLSYDT